MKKSTLILFLLVCMYILIGESVVLTKKSHTEQYIICCAKNKTELIVFGYRRHINCIILYVSFHKKKYIYIYIYIYNIIP